MGGQHLGKVLTREAILIIQQHTALPATAPVDIMDTSTMSDQEDERGGKGEPVKNQVELATLEEYDISSLTIIHSPDFMIWGNYPIAEAEGQSF